MKSTPMMAQYNSFKKQYPDKIVLFRMGDFYETFGEDAKIAAEVLNITLTTRDKNDDPTPLAGFPYHAIDQYLPKLIEAGHCTVVVEQLEDPKQAKGVVKRGVTRIVTPGTLEGEFASRERNPYLMAIAQYKKVLGVSICDLSTGELLIGEVQDDKSLLSRVINSYDPVEIVIDPSKTNLHFENLQVQFQEIPKIGDRSNNEYIEDFFKIQSVNSLGIENDPTIIASLSILLRYIEETQKMKPQHIQIPLFISLTNTMVLDRSTIKNLDLVRNSYTGTDKETLLSTIQNCKTSMGKRELYFWVLNPLIERNSIANRLTVVELLYEDQVLLNEIRESFSFISDIYRLIGKIGLNRMNGRDMNSLESSMKGFIDLSQLLKRNEKLINTLLNSKKINELVEIADNIRQSIENTIVDNPPLLITEGKLIKNGINNEIDEIREQSVDSRKWLKELEQKERTTLNIPSLKVRSNKVFGFYIEVTKTHVDKVPQHYMRKQTLVNSERYITEELKQKEEMILHADEKLGSLEYEEFQKLRNSLIPYLDDLRTIASLITKLDILAGFADTALMFSYTKPIILEKEDKGGILKIVEGRHPVVERLISDQFITNDTNLGIDKDRMMIITGPNMSGKSTYIRQVALITLMAQIGSFVPAKEVELSIVDRIFSRVGASDNLAQGRSTFMVEMEEAANILNNATSNSLIILDEVGRGTSTYDGVSIAWALAEYIANNIKARTLFATHYHELTALAESFPNIINNYNVMVKDEGEEVIFMRKIIPGGTDKSYGVYVAQLAGIKKEVISRANEIMRSFDIGKSFGEDLSQAVKSSNTKGSNEVQYELFNNEYTDLVDEINAFDINEITPLEAMNILQSLIAKIKKK